MRVVELRHVSYGGRYFDERLVIVAESGSDEIEACLEVVRYGENRDLILYESAGEYIAVRIRPEYVAVSKVRRTPNYTGCYTAVAIDETKFRRVVKVVEEDGRVYEEVIHEHRPPPS